MKVTHSKRPMTILIAGLFVFCVTAPGQTLPVTWDETALASMQTPLRDPTRTPKHMASATYNRIPALGHEYGISLKPNEKSAPIAFLTTL